MSAASSNREPRAVAFFDRDGVINHDLGFVHKPEDIRWMPGVGEALKLAHQRGFLCVVVSNQSGVARGFFTEQQVRELHEWMGSVLKREGAVLDGFYFCPHYPQGTVAPYGGACECRKPAPGLLLQAFQELEGQVKGSFLIGDRQSDMEAAQAAGVEGYLFGGGNLWEFVRDVLEGAGSPAPKMD